MRTILREGDGERLVADERRREALRLARAVAALLDYKLIPRPLLERARALAEDIDEIELLLAFPIGTRRTSPGTWDCIEAAVERGIPVRIFPMGGA